jgi:anti-sigma regulatory factor (Ser/Thr protein kinase)
MEIILGAPVAAQSRHTVTDPSMVGEVRRQAQRLAQLHGLSEESAGRAAIVATELANNLLQHGGGGELLLQSIESQESQRIIEVLAIDRGRGMENPERCLTDGFSTAGTMGTGLGAVRRLAAEFDLYSSADEGAVVMARIGMGTAPHLGAINLALAGEAMVCLRRKRRRRESAPSIRLRSTLPGSYWSGSIALWPAPAARLRLALISVRRGGSPMPASAISMAHWYRSMARGAWYRTTARSVCALPACESSSINARPVRCW